MNSTDAAMLRLAYHKLSEEKIGSLKQAQANTRQKMEIRRELIKAGWWTETGKPCRHKSK